MGDESILSIRFKVNDDGSIVLDKIAGKIQQTAGHVEGMNKSLGLIKLDSIVNLGARAFHTGEQIYNMAKETAKSINEIDRMAKISGLSSDAFQKLSYAAKMTDVDVESLGRGMKILAGHMDDVSKGKDEAIFLFKSIGVETKDAAGKTKSFDEILGNIADRFKMMPDGVDKVALAVDLFGKTGQNLIPTLNKGSAGLKELYQMAERLGIVLDEKLIKKGSELEHHFKKASAWWTAFFQKIVVGAYEAIEAIEKLRKKHGEFFTKDLEISPWKKLFGKKSPVSMFSVGDTGLEGLGETPAYLRQSSEALKAIKEANDKIIEQNYKLSDLYDYEANVLKGMAGMEERRAKAMEIMEQLGVKTKKGAEEEVAAIQKKFQMLIGKGYSTEEMAKAKEKLTEELKKIQEKYSMKPAEEGPGGHWEETMVPSGKEISGIRARTTWESDWRWIEDIGVKSNKAKDELTRNVEEMVEKSIEELNRMQRQMESLTGPQKITIDTSQFDSVSQGIDILRQKMESLTNQTYPLRISIVGGEKAGVTNIYQIDNEFTNLAQNKRSRFMEMVREVQGEE